MGSCKIKISDKRVAEKNISDRSKSENKISAKAESEIKISGQGDSENKISKPRSPREKQPLYEGKSGINAHITAYIPSNLPLLRDRILCFKNFRGKNLC